MIRGETPTVSVELCCAEPSTGVGELLPKWRRALPELLTAFDYAHSVHIDIWQFAVGIAELRAAGLRDSDCRWLVCAGYAEHAQEVTRIDDDSRRFRLVHNLSFFTRSCFVLTARGVAFARAATVWMESRLVDQPISSPALDQPKHAEVLLPHWNPERHELHLGVHLVKQFKWNAMNQQTILAAFEEEGWPDRIDDPLSPQREQDPKRRLHDTIKCLNRNQRHRLMRFGGDGTGEGVIWSLVEPVDWYRG